MEREMKRIRSAVVAAMVGSLVLTGECARLGGKEADKSVASPGSQEQVSHANPSDYTYSTNPAGQATITGFSRAYSGALIITNVLGGCPVAGIATRAFDGCLLNSVKVPGCVTSIARAAFSRCPRLAAINVDEDNANYSSVDGVLYNKSQTTLIDCPTGRGGAISLPFSVSDIDASAFYGCSRLTGINVDVANESYGSVDGVLFDKNQTTLVEFPSGKSGAVFIPSSVNMIEGTAFSGILGCPELTAINVDESNVNYSSVDGVLFDNKQTTLIKYPAQKAGGYTVPSGVTSIEDTAFWGCSRLTEVILGSNVTKIGYIAFGACTTLTAITVLSEVTKVGNYAFSSCPRLTSVFFWWKRPPLDGFIGFERD